VIPSLITRTIKRGIEKERWVPLKSTIKDVAKLAGVSKSTVSQYINKRYSYMSEDTRRKIGEAIKQLDYYPNQIAKSLKQKNTNVIALVCATLSSRFSLELIGTAEAFFQKEQYSVIVASSGDDPIRERALIESFIARQVDGILVFPTKENQEFYQEVKKREVPLVFVDRVLPEANVPSVLLDNEKASAKATQLLIDNGHQKIAIITFPLGDDITTRFERLAGYKKTIEKNKIPFHPEYVISRPLGEVRDALDSLLHTADKPTAIILTNDMLLEETLIWSKDQKVKIPDIFSIVGIDDVSFARLFEPQITTLAQPVTKIALKASELLLDQIKADKKINKKNLVTRYPAELIIRSSIKKIK
jgi:LacI family kdg operon repressor